MSGMRVFVFAGLLIGCASAPPPARTHPESAPEVEASLDGEILRLSETFGTRAVGRTVAVLEFPDLQNRTTDLSRLISEELTTALVRSLGSRGRVVERRHVLQVLAEENLAKADLTREQVSHVGRRLGASAIVLGSAAVVGERLVVNARLVDVASFDVLAADRMSVKAERQLLGLAGGTATPLRVGAAAKLQPAGPVLDWTNGDLRVELVGIERAQAGTTVTVLLTNLRSQQFKVSFLRRRLYLVDDRGIRYNLVGGDGFERSQDPVARHMLVPQLARRFALVFEGRTEEVRSVTAVLNLGYGGIIGCCAKALATMGPVTVTEEQAAR